jgi:hypothetical protein
VCFIFYDDDDNGAEIALLDETLASLSKKAHDLQSDKWMFDDVRI